MGPEIDPHFLGEPDFLGAPLVEWTAVHPAAIVPSRAHPSDAGYDLALCETVNVPAGAFLDLPTGLRICQPPGLWCRLVGRSSTFRRHGLLVLEGIIDTDYTGDLFVGVYNPGPLTKVLPAGTRIAQAIFAWAQAVEFQHVIAERFPSRPVDRGMKGFGSTGS